jgi:phage terminase large subunit-like protein
MKVRAVIDVLEGSTGARRQPLVFKITTAGTDPKSPCGDEHDYACQILDGVLVDESYFAFIAHADVDDDWTTELAARKANPNYGVSVSIADLASKRVKAIGIPSAAATYKQKHLNLWVSAALPWLSLDGWRRGQTPGADLLELLTGELCVVGIDLASKLDLCAMTAAFPPTDTRLNWNVVRWVWTPLATLEERRHRDRAPYDQWIDRGYLIGVPGTRVDHRVIRDTLKVLAAQVEIAAIGFDPWHADQLQVQLVSDDGFAEDQVLEVSQTFAGMSSGCKTMEAAVLAGEVDAGGCPLMEWCVSNAVVQRDNKDNIYPVKRRSRGRIDPVVAMAIAWNLWGRLEAEAPPADDPDLVVV